MEEPNEQSDGSEKGPQPGGCQGTAYPEEDVRTSSRSIRLDYARPPKRRAMLLWWGLSLAAALAVQRLTVGTFETGNWIEPTPTLPEKLWYRLPLAFIVAVSTVFYIAAVRRLPTRPRGVILKRALHLAWVLGGASAGLALWCVLLWCGPGFACIVAIGTACYLLVEHPALDERRRHVQRWGIGLALVALFLSVVMSAYYAVLVWYMD